MRSTIYIPILGKFWVMRRPVVAPPGAADAGDQQRIAFAWLQTTVDSPEPSASEQGINGSLGPGAGCGLKEHKSSGSMAKRARRAWRDGDDLDTGQNVRGDQPDGVITRETIGESGCLAVTMPVGVGPRHNPTGLVGSRRRCAGHEGTASSTRRWDARTGERLVIRWPHIVRLRLTCPTPDG